MESVLHSLFIVTARNFQPLSLEAMFSKEVAQHVLDKRKDKGRYPIYITDIDVTRSMLGVDGALNLQTVHFMNYKRNIEHKLNTAMSKL